MTMRGAIRPMSVATLAILSACAVGPDYVRPTAPVPEAYKEVDGWKPGTPREAQSGSSWWSIYDDPVLDGLEQRIDISNQTLKESEAAYSQAQAIVGEATAAYFPTLSLNGSGTRSGQGAGSSSASSRNISSAHAASTSNQFSLSAGASWAPDIWGKIRRTVESDVATAAASGDDLAAARLSAQTTLATDYLQLRVEDELKRLLDAAATAYTRSLTISRNKYNAGTAAKSDVMTAQAQLETTQAQAIATGVQRAQLEHAIAVLVGKPPSDFSIAPLPFKSDVPVVPAGVPSTLLERRPDIAGAERRAAAANAQIGVAVAAYYPDITLSASYGFTSSAIDNLIRAANKVWSFGPSLSETVFDGGLRGAQVEAARATFDQSVATYRQTVLAAFQQVEDELAALRILERQDAAQAIAVRDAQEAERLELNQYIAGTVDYTSVVTAQTAALGDEESALTIRENRLVASVSLIEALGGGWSVDQPPVAAAPAKGAAE